MGARFAPYEPPGGGGGGIFLNPPAALDAPGGGGGGFLKPEPDAPEAVDAFVVALDSPLAPVSCFLAILIAKSGLGSLSTRSEIQLTSTRSTLIDRQPVQTLPRISSPLLILG